MVKGKTIRIKTTGNGDIIDITAQVAGEVDSSGIESGIVTIFCVGSTLGITTMEHESGLLTDFGDVWEKLVPAGVGYHHNQVWGDGNGHSHLRASLLGASLTVPFTNRRMALGTWQQIICVDFDNRPRSREIVLQIIGD